MTPLRAEIEGQDPASEALRTELAALARDKSKLSDEDVRALCDQLALRKAPQKCAVATAGALLESKLVPRRHVIGAHVEGHLRIDRRLRIFIYGHTHKFEEGWPLNVAGGLRVIIHNTGAFQRTVDEAGFLARVAQKNLAPSDALRKIKLESLLLGGTRDLLFLRRSQVKDLALAPRGKWPGNSSRTGR